jgi:hypothetical protein
MKPVNGNWNRENGNWKIETPKRMQPVGTFGVHAFATPTSPPHAPSYEHSQGVQRMSENAALDMGG